jgi:hypothetical protein
MFIVYPSTNVYVILSLILCIAEYLDSIYGHANILLDINYIVKIIQTTFYKQPHKNFNFIIFNEMLIKQKLSNFCDVQPWNSLRMTQIYRSM